MKTVFEKMASRIRQRMRESLWARISVVLSVVVVFCTTYVLILPALTLTSDSSSSIIQTEDTVTAVTSDSSKESTETTQQDKKQEPQVSESTPSTSKTLSSDSHSSKAGSQKAETENVIVKVDYEAETFSESVTLRVKHVTDTTAIDAKLSDVLKDRNRILTSSYTYDISFVNNQGKEVEPSKEVKVSLTFKDAVEASTIQEGWKLYHFKNNDVNQVEDLTDSHTTNIQETDKAVSVVEFMSDTFSQYTIAGTSYEDFSTYITSGNYKGKPVEYISGNTRTLTSELDLKYSIPKSQLAQKKSYAIPLPADTTWSNVNENQDYIGKDGNRDAFKYRFVQENGKKYIVINFLDSYVNQAHESVLGDLTYTATIGQTHRKENGNYEIPFTDKVTITVPSDKIDKKEEPQQSDHDVQSQKTGAVTYNGDEAYLDYTVTVWSEKGTKGQVKINDYLDAKGLTIGELQNLTIKKAGYQYWGGTETDQVGEQPLSVQPVKSGTSFELTLPKLEAKQKYTIKYRYKVTGIPAGQAISVSNGVDVETPDIPKKHSDSYLSIFRNKIGKTGQYDEKSNKIKWTITVNENQNDIAGAELKDEMIAKSSDVAITPSNGATKTNTGYKFSATDGGKNTNKYVITYTTDAGEKSNSWAGSAKSISNTATITDNGQDSSTTATVPGGNGNTGGLEKSFVEMKPTGDSDVKELTWNSIIKVPGDRKIPKNAEFEDLLKGPNYTNSGEHYFTKAQLDAVYQKLITALGGADKFEFSVWESNNSTWQYTPYNQADSNKTYSQFKFKLLKDYTGSDISFDYQSTINKSKATQFSNTISGGGFNKEANYKYEENGKVFKLDGNNLVWDGKENEYDSKDTEHTIQQNGLISWVIKVKLSDDTQSVTLTDTPPAGLTLSKFSYGASTYGINASDFSISDGKITWSNQWYRPFGNDLDVTGTVDASGVINVTFTAKNGKKLKELLNNTGTLYAKFEFKTDAKPFDDSITKNYKNKVSAKIDGKPAGEDDHTQKITVEPGRKISKGGTWSNDNREVSYKLDINPEAQDLAAGKSSYTLVDTLEYREDLLTNISYDLKQESVKLYDSNHQEIDKSEWSWTVKKVKDTTGVHRSIITLQVPNRKKLHLEYSYAVSSDIAENDTKNLTVKNTAEINGLKTGQTETTTHYNWHKTSTSATANTLKSFKITKVDTTNFATALADATFEIRENVTDKKVATYKTSSDGTFYITKSNKEAREKEGELLEDKLYYAVEVKAPSGYELPANPKRYYFYFSNTATLPSNIGSLVIGTQEVTNLAKQSRQEYVENTKTPPMPQTTSIIVDKKWKNADGSEAQRVSGKITVSLYRVSNIESAPVKITEKEISYDGSKWQTIFENLPTTGENGETFTYYVEESKVTGYTASYSNGTRVSETATDMAISKGTITITNKAQKTYQLPETGGEGIATIMLVGASLVILSVFAVGFKVYRQIR